MTRSQSTPCSSQLINCEQRVEKLEEEMNALRADAARYRWLIQKMQDSYDGEAAEDYEVTVTCSMLFGRKEVRRVQAEISWFDERDEDLNLGAAIDRAMLAETIDQAIAGGPTT